MVSEAAVDAVEVLEVLLAVVEVLRKERKFGSFIVKAVFAGKEMLGKSRNRLFASSSTSRFIIANSSKVNPSLLLSGKTERLKTDPGYIG